MVIVIDKMANHICRLYVYISVNSVHGSRNTLLKLFQKWTLSRILFEPSTLLCFLGLDLFGTMFLNNEKVVVQIENFFWKLNLHYSSPRT